MKQIKENVKDIITDLIGLTIILGTLYALWIHKITWIWEGFAGMGVGGIFFLLPDAMIKDALNKVINYFTKNDSSN
jgi:hypothetical protein